MEVPNGLSNKNLVLHGQANSPGRYHRASRAADFEPFDAVAGCEDHEATVSRLLDAGVGPAPRPGIPLAAIGLG